MPFKAALSRRNRIFRLLPSSADRRKKAGRSPTTAGVSFDAICGLRVRGPFVLRRASSPAPTAAETCGCRLPGIVTTGGGRFGGAGLGLGRRRVHNRRRQRLVLRDLGLVNSTPSARTATAMQRSWRSLHSPTPLSLPHSPAEDAGVPSPWRRVEFAARIPCHGLHLIVLPRSHDATAECGRSWPGQCRCLRSWW